MDEFGGYCNKKLSKKKGCAEGESDDSHDFQQYDICEQLGLNIDKTAYELVRGEFGLHDDYYDYDQKWYQDFTNSYAKKDVSNGMTNTMSNLSE